MSLPRVRLRGGDGREGDGREKDMEAPDHPGAGQAARLTAPPDCATIVIGSYAENQFPPTIGHDRFVRGRCSLYLQADGTKCGILYAGPLR
ncbi:MAG: hypothetical protein VST65_08280 [Nitrospirota bacterium]|nr:hypothetical protein [Nitrospirota bacterium]